MANFYGAFMDHLHKNLSACFKMPGHLNKHDSMFLTEIDVQHTILWKVKEIALCHGNINIFYYTIKSTATLFFLTLCLYFIALPWKSKYYSSSKLWGLLTFPVFVKEIISNAHNHEKTLLKFKVPLRIPFLNTAAGIWPYNTDQQSQLSIRYW